MCDDVFNLRSVTFDLEPDPGGIVFQVFLMAADEFHNAGSVLLPIFLWVSEEGAANEVFRVKDRGRLGVNVVSWDG